MAPDGARRDLVAYGRRLYEKGFVAATDGNLSVRLPGGGFLATPTGLHEFTILGTFADWAGKTNGVSISMVDHSKLQGFHGGRSAPSIHLCRSRHSHRDRETQRHAKARWRPGGAGF